jgi:hypothetical protein
MIDLKMVWEVDVRLVLERMHAWMPDDLMYG